MKDFILKYDENKNDSGFYPQSDIIYNVVLAADTPESITVPVGAEVAEFSANGDFWCRFNTAAAVPTTEVVDSGSELNPTRRTVVPGQPISFSASSPTLISIAFYNIAGAIKTHTHVV
jgi:hypothetical protein